MFFSVISFFVMIFSYACVYIFLILFKIYKFFANFSKRKELLKLRKQLVTEQDYQKWKKLAFQYDVITDRLGWRYNPKSSFYDHQHLQQVNKYINFLIKEKSTEDLMQFLKAILSRTSSGIKSQNLYNYTISGTKQLIEEYYQNVKKSFEFIYKSKVVEKKQFFQDLARIQGNSALLLSGGGLLGLFHLGLIIALKEENCLPRIFTGSSAGSLISALISTKTSKEFDEMMRNNFDDLDLSYFDEPKDEKFSLIKKLKRFYRTKYLLDKEPLKQAVKFNSNNMTFKEAYDKTGQILNISVTDNIHEKYRLLNYFTSPNVYIWSATLASCSLPFAISPSKIYAKNKNGEEYEWMPMKKKGFRDGSMGGDIPKELLAVLFNANNLIVSQVNIHIAPFISGKKFNGAGQKRYFISKLFNLVSGFIASEIRLRISQLQSINIFPKKLFFLANAFLQEYTGTVNIVPKIYFRDLFRLLNMPQKKFFEEFIKRGRNEAFFHIEHIKHIMFIEQQLEIYCKKFEE